LFSRRFNTTITLLWLSALLLAWPLAGSAQSVTDDPLYRLAKDFKDPTTWFLVARKFYLGKEYPLDKAEAANWFKKAADAGHSKAQWYLGRMYANGDGVKKDKNRAVKYLQQAHKGGQEEASYDLAMLYMNDGDAKPDFKTAAKWLTEAAQQDHAKAAFLLGKLAVEGKIENYDLTQAEKWLRLASDLGVEEANEYLSQLTKKKQQVDSVKPGAAENAPNKSGKLESPAPFSTSTVLVAQIRALVSPQTSPSSATDVNADLETLVAKALKGEAKAQFRLGMQLLRSDASRELAVEWLRKASNQNHAEASYQLGLIYRDGIGVQRNDSKAMELFRQVTDEENAAAETVEKAASALNSMLIYKNSRLLNDKAITATRSPLDSLIRDAKSGRKEAQAKLAELYQNGVGVAQDDMMAKHWLHQSGMGQGDEQNHATPRCKRC